MSAWLVIAEHGDLRIIEREECIFYTVPASDIAHVLQALLRSCDTRPGEPAPGAREMLAGFEEEIEWEEPDICERRWPEGRRAA